MQQICFVFNTLNFWIYSNNSEYIKQSRAITTPILVEAGVCLPMNAENMNHVLAIATRALDNTIPPWFFTGVTREECEFSMGWKYRLNKYIPDMGAPTPNPDATLEVQVGWYSEDEEHFLEIVSDLPFKFKAEDVHHHIKLKFPEFDSNNLYSSGLYMFVIRGSHTDEILKYACETIFMLAIADVLSRQE